MLDRKLSQPWWAGWPRFINNSTSPHSETSFILILKQTKCKPPPPVFYPIHPFDSSPLADFSSPIPAKWNLARRPSQLQVADLHRLFKNGNWMGCSQKSCRGSFSVALLWLTLYSRRMKEALLSHYGFHVAETWWLPLLLNGMFDCRGKTF